MGNIVDGMNIKNVYYSIVDSVARDTAESAIKKVEDAGLDTMQTEIQENRNNISKNTTSITNINTDLNTLFTKLGGLDNFAIDDNISATSVNPVQNKVIKSYIDEILGNIQTTLAVINGELETAESEYKITSNTLVVKDSATNRSYSLTFDEEGVLGVEEITE